MPQPSARAREAYRYGLLLCLIAGSLAFQLAASTADWARIVTVVLQGATLLLALWTSRVKRLLFSITAFAVTVALAASTVALLSDGAGGTASTALVSLLLVGIAPTAVLVGAIRSVRQDGGVTLPTMFAVLCVYLLLGMFFAFLYGAIDVLGSGTLFTEEADPAQADFLYFSFTTLTTTGYGDLTVGAGVGRAAAITEALLGQVYLVTVVAAIVSNLRPRRP